MVINGIQLIMVYVISAVWIIDASTKLIVKVKLLQKMDLENDPTRMNEEELEDYRWKVHNVKKLYKQNIAQLIVACLLMITNVLLVIVPHTLSWP